MSMMDPVFESFVPPFQLSKDEMIKRAQAFRNDLVKRRTIREYESGEIPSDLIETCIEAAATAPSGANKQPWHFVVITDPGVKASIRVAAEKEERSFYAERAPQEWLEALHSLGTDYNKPFLEEAPVLIAIFAQNYEMKDDGTRTKNYYVQESVGIATGMLITALHLSGLSTLTHTPSPMGFLNEILGRPKHERAFLLLVVGTPAANALVPKISKKAVSEIVSYH